MKLDLQSLSTEPLVYMLMHSGAFVTVLGIVFFLIGLLFGRITWGRYKGQSRELRAEAEAMKEEVANLKRKLGDLSVKSGPAVPIVTEMIALPKKEAPQPAAPAPEAKKSADKFATKPPAPTPEPSASSQPNVIKSRASSQPESAANGASATSNPPWSPVLASASIPTPAPAPAFQDRTDTPDLHASTLAAIIAPTASPKKDPASSVEKDMLVLPEIPVSGSPRPPAAPPTAKPDFDFDPQLGLIYKSKPGQIDDLTALKGVASTLEQRLQALGVYTYEQIASWTGDQVREFSARLAFKDRIEREQWVEQARELLAGGQRANGVMQTVASQAGN